MCTCRHSRSEQDTRTMPLFFNLTTDSACLDTVSEQDEIVGHISQRMATYVSRFFKRSTNAGTVKVTGKRVNRGAGYGLEIPCIYTFNVDTGTSIPWLRCKLFRLGYSVK